MTAATTPLWVPILVGALGFVGVLLSQWMSNARAERDRAATDARDLRRLEFERESSQRTTEREDRYRSHEQRQEAYAAFIGQFENWSMAVSRLTGRLAEGGSISRLESNELRAMETAIRGAMARLELLAPPGIRGGGRGLWISAGFVAWQAESWNDGGDPTALLSAYQDALRAYWRLLDDMRVNLGVEPEDPEVVRAFEQGMKVGAEDFQSRVWSSATERSTATDRSTDPAPGP